MVKRIGRVSQAQREKMLEFMSSHPELAKGRLGGPPETRIKKRLIAKLASSLNTEKGATKSADKWYKCWQDWKSDTKAKALKIIKYKTGSKKGPTPAALTNLEETLLDLLGKESINKLTIQDTLAEYEEELEQFEVDKEDPLGASTSSEGNESAVTPVAPVAPVVPMEHPHDHHHQHVVPQRPQFRRGAQREPNVNDTDPDIVETVRTQLVDAEQEVYETVARCLRNIASSMFEMSAAVRSFGRLCVDVDVPKLLQMYNDTASPN